MSRELSFRNRLLVSFALVVALSLAVPMIYAGHVLDRETDRVAGETAVRRLEFLAGMLEGVDGPRSLEGLERMLSRAAATSGGYWAYLDPRGRVLAEAGEVPAGGADFSGLADGEARAGLLLDDRVRAMVPVTISGLPRGRLATSTALEAARSRTRGLVLNFGLGVGLALVLASAVVLVLARQMGRSVTGMTRVAEAIGRGEYGRRMRIYPGREFEPLAEAINHMAESIQAQIGTITWQKQQLEAILDGMKEGVMVLDERGRIAAMNRALMDIFPGMETQVGKHPLEAIMDVGLQEACEAALAGEDGERTRTLHMELDQGRAYEVGIVRLASPQTGVGAVAVFHDISEIKRLEQVRRDFVANVSHELRTPLTSIKGYAETIMESGEAASRKVFLEVIVRNANHMTKIVEDLLSLSRLEAGRQEFEMRPLDPAPALRTAIRECRHPGFEQEVELACELDDGLRVVGDYNRLVQVFRNLVENAMKYSPKNGRICIFGQRTADEVLIGVSDQGPGVPRADRQRIFERFYRVEKHRLKVQAGSSGLGLAIAKHIVERFGGRIWVESPARGAETGATFFVALKPAPEEEIRPPGTDALENRANG
jgi:two-component system phosphate regulon sensor histidine kinase PhoR